MERKKSPGLPWPFMLLFLLVMLGTAYIAFRLNGRTPAYESGTLLPGAQWDGVISVRGLKPEGKDFVFTIRSQEPLTGLALMISNSSPVSVYQDGRMIYTQHTNDVFHRSQVIPLGDFSGESTLRIHPEGGGEEPEYRVTLGSLNYIQDKLALILSWNTFLLGLLAMLSVSAFILYIKKRGEQYLVHIGIASLLSLVNLAMVYGIFGLSASYEIVMSVRSTVLLLCPLEIFYVVQRLYPEYGGPFSQGVGRTYTVLICAAAFLCSLNLIPSSIGYYARLLVLPMSVLCLSRALRAGRLDALLVLMAYGVMEGLCLMAFVAAKGSYYGELLGFWRLMEVAQILFLAASACVVYLRFAERFRESERLQAALGELNATLEDRVEDRTRELKEQQERRQATMQNIFHDLRSPLYVLQSQVRKLPDIAENQEARKTLQSRLGYMQRLIEDLFLIANLESNNIMFDADQVDMAEMLRAILQGLQTVAAEKGIALSLEAPAPCMVWGDPFRLQQALQNLADNAIAHTPAGGTVAFSALEAGGNIQIAVHNTGKAISPEELPLIFQRYYRSKRARGSKSSGLGLSIAKEIVEAQGGKIWVESLEGQGSTFYVSLPPL